MGNGFDSRRMAGSRWRRAAAVALAGALVGAPMALAVSPGRYQGRTSQDRRVQVRVTSPTRMDIERFSFRGRCESRRRFQASLTAQDVRLSRRGFFADRLEGRGRILGVGKGRFRYRITGQVRRERGEGRFRGTFRSGDTVCWSVLVKFKLRRR